ncbi:MAG: hypothetical protein VYC34_11685, partial [Planctomycetota bacterium]|nr:hypothetical protein [Planctomycetota bacterium]
MIDAASASQIDLGYRIGVEVAKKTFDAARAEGQAALELLDAAASVGDASRGAVSPVPGPGET